MKAPKVDYWIRALRDGKMVFDEETNKVIDRVFDEIRKVLPIGDDGKRELWLKAERGTEKDYGDYEYYKEEEIVDSYEDFLRMRKEEYPDEVKWFNLITFERDDYRCIFLGRELIYQSEFYGKDDSYGYNLESLFLWMEDSVKNAIKELENGTYNDDVNNNLSFRERTGTILRKDYWDLFPDRKEDYLSDITKEEIELFVNNIKEQKDEEPIGRYITDMTSGKFYEFCALGYEANKYENLEGLTAKEKYYKMADGRDEGLSDLNIDSNEEFDAWYNDRNRWGGHPWEVCAGGNSTHIDLVVWYNEQGYFLNLRGKSWGRSIETIKFYNALRKDGVAVYLSDSKGITHRLLGRDIIGIVPQHVIPRYCQSWFPGMEILDFMNLPYEENEYEKILPKVTWLKEKEAKLL